jgi:hypothetical protein
MRTRDALRNFAVGSTLLVMAGCTPTISSIETEQAICEAWESTLFLPSRQDTPETAVGLNKQFDIQEAACPRR